MNNTCNSPVLHSSKVYEEFKEIFSLVDRDGGGSISSDELEHLLSIIGIEASNEEVDAMIKEVDTDNSGEIEFNGQSPFCNKMVVLHFG